MSDQTRSGGPAHHRGASGAAWAVMARRLRDLDSTRQGNRAADGALAPHEVRAQALACQASPTLEESEFQLLLGELLDVSGSGASAADQPASFSAPGAPALPPSPFGASPISANPIEQSPYGCGVATPSQPPQLSTADSTCQTALAVPVVLVRPAPGSEQAPASLLEPATPFKPPARPRLARRVSYEGSNELSITTVELALHSDASRPNTPAPERRAARKWDIKSSSAARPHSHDVPAKPQREETASVLSSRSSLKRRVQNREAQQRRRLRLKARRSSYYELRRDRPPAAIARGQGQ